MVGMDWMLDLMTLEIFSNINDSITPSELWYEGICSPLLGHANLSCGSLVALFLPVNTGYSEAVYIWNIDDSAVVKRNFPEVFALEKYWPMLSS